MYIVVSNPVHQYQRDLQYHVSARVRSGLGSIQIFEHNWVKNRRVTIQLHDGPLINSLSLWVFALQNLFGSPSLVIQQLQSSICLSLKHQVSK